VDPRFFVNRPAEAERLKRRLRDWIHYRKSDGLLLIRGERGIGKSIFGRSVLQDIACEFPKRVLPVVVNERFVGDRSSLRKLAQALATEARDALERAGRAEEITRWVQPLLELIFADRISLGVKTGQSLERSEGGEHSISLLQALSSKGFVHTRSQTNLGLEVGTSLDVTPELLKQAVIALLEHLKDSFTVIIFFDDLDQAANMDNMERARATVEGVLELTPCIALLHLRTEISLPDVQREAPNGILLDLLPPAELLRLVKHRLEHTNNSEAAQRDRKLMASTPGAWVPFEAFLAATGNPYIYLRWMSAVIDSSPQWPPPESWWTEDHLRTLAVDSTLGQPLPAELALRLGRLIDHLGRSVGLSEKDLLQGGSTLENRPHAGHLTPAELDQLKRHDYLRPMDRFDPGPGLCLNPALELLRPSVQKKVLSARLQPR
jgi:hypothetical protein